MSGRPGSSKPASRMCIVMPLLLSTSRERIPTGMVVWPYSTSLLVMVPPVSQRPDDAEFRSIGNANGLFHIPTKQKRRSTGQGAKSSLDPQRPEKRWVLRHLRPRAFAPQASVMASSEQDDVATIIPVSCDGVKTHVIMDDSIECSGGAPTRFAIPLQCGRHPPMNGWDAASF